MTEQLQNHNHKKRNVGIVIFLLVLCIFGLSMLPHNSNVKSSVTMKDVQVDFSGANVASVNSLSVSDWTGVIAYPSVSGGISNFAVPTGDYCTVTYSYQTDALGWTSGTGSVSFTSGSGSTLQYVPVTLSTSMQVTPKKLRPNFSFL